MPIRHQLVLAILGALGLCAGCASGGLTPLQERADSAFKDCQSVAPTAQITELLPDGRFRYSAAPGDVTRMRECLEQRYGYKFQ